MTRIVLCKSPAAHPFSTPDSHENHDKLAVIKVSGGLGTFMGPCFLSHEDITLNLFRYD